MGALVEGAALIDGEAYAKEYPITFMIPSEYARKNVRIGDMVKIGLAAIHSGVDIGERFWATVVAVRPPPPPRSRVIVAGPPAVGRSVSVEMKSSSAALVEPPSQPLPARQPVQRPPTAPQVPTAPRTVEEMAGTARSRFEMEIERARARTAERAPMLQVEVATKLYENWGVTFGDRLDIEPRHILAVEAKLPPP